MGNLRHNPPDVVLIDTDGTRDWQKVLSDVAKMSPRSRAILIGDLSRESILNALERGVRGVVTPSANAEVLAKSIRYVAAGEYWIGHRHFAAIMDCIQSREAQSQKTSPLGLTPREKDVLGDIVRGYSNREIANHFSISAQAVKHHLSNIFEKLGVCNRLELAICALKHELINDGLQTIPKTRSSSPAAPSNGDHDPAEHAGRIHH